MSDTSSTQADTTTAGDTGTAVTTTPQLDQVYEQYEAAFADFSTKLDTLNSAKAAVTSAAVNVNTIKQQLDELEAEVNANFSVVQPFLAMT